MKIKSFTTLLLCCGLTIMAVAQCPTTDITLDSQADIDNFSTNYPECTMIPAGVNIIIEEALSDNITNLDGLSQLISVGGGLSIENNVVLTNLDGLSQITSVGGGLSIENNVALTNLNGLSQITSISESLYIQDNPALTNLDGLSQISFDLHYLYISSNATLTNLDGLSQTSSVSKILYIRDNPALTNLDGLSQISSYVSNLSLIDNPILMNLDGLSQIPSFGSIYIDDNDALTNLDGISQITSVGSLNIIRNDALMNVNGLSQITSISGLLQIYNNPQLNQCCALCPLLAADAADPNVIGGNITIGNNLTGCNSPTQINACSPCDLVSTSMPEYDPTQLNIYPNPAKNILHFQYDIPKDELVNFTIENHLGQQIIQSQAYTNQSVQLDISGYPAGLYVLNVLRGNESMSRLFNVSR